MRPVFSDLAAGMAQRKQVGVSLVEVLIVFVVVAALAAAGVPAFQEWIANARVRATSDNILNGLQVARAEAIKRNRYVDFRLDADGAGGWSVVSASDNAMCPVADAPAAGDVLQRRSPQDAASKLKVTAQDELNAETLRVTFTPMGMVTRGCGSTFTTLEVTSEAITTPRLLRVTVGTTGGMRMCEPSRPDTDPRACPTNR